jgi:hypothetical protein
LGSSRRREYSILIHRHVGGTVADGSDALFGASFELRETLKRRGYRWDPGEGGGTRALFVDVTDGALGDERNFLRREIYRRDGTKIAARRFDAFDRYSGVADRGIGWRRVAAAGGGRQRRRARSARARLSSRTLFSRNPVFPRIRSPRRTIPCTRSTSAAPRPPPSEAEGVGGRRPLRAAAEPAQHLGRRSWMAPKLPRRVAARPDPARWGED